jgi:AcrR family transcriptional regulator
MISDVVLPSRLGRPKGGSAEVTRERILDAAEALFADGGYEGTSIRDIAERAAIGLAVVGYHFGPKEALFDAVIARRAGIMNDQRYHALRAARREAGDQPIAVEALIRGYVAPFIEYARQGDEGWRNYAVLMGRLANSPRGTEVIAKHYDPTARALIDELIRTLPHADRAALVEGFMTMVSAMLFICASTGRLRVLAAAFDSTTDDTAIFENLVAFNAAGFRALNGGANL